MKLNDETPCPKRKSITKETIAARINQGVATHDEVEELFDSIYKMAYSIVSKNFNPDLTRDVIQTVALVVWEKLYQYQVEIGPFNNWLWTVIWSIRRNWLYDLCKEKEIFVYLDFEDPETDGKNSNIKSHWKNVPEKNVLDPSVKLEIVLLIKKLFKKYSKSHHLLYAIFGDPFSEDYVIQFNSIAEVARKTGVKESKVRKFVKDKIYTDLTESGIREFIELKNLFK